MRKLVRWTVLAASLAVAVPLPSTASAQEGDDQTETPGESRSAEFRAMEGPPEDQVPGGALMVAAYGLVWLLVLLYVFRVGKLGAATARDVERLEKSLARGDGETDEKKKG